MKESVLDEYLSLRLVIGHLGELNQFGWWPTSFFEPSSKLFLDPVFPKTRLMAQSHGVREAACRLHDEHIGLGDAFHLFRLPEEVEQDLHHLLQGGQGANLLAKLKDQETALAALSAIAGGTTAAAVGPVAVGEVTDLLAPGALRKIAQYYFAAFNHDTRTFPYFKGTSGR